MWCQGYQNFLKNNLSLQVENLVTTTIRVSRVFLAQNDQQASSYAKLLPNFHLTNERLRNIPNPQNKTKSYKARKETQRRLSFTKQVFFNSNRKFTSATYRRSFFLITLWKCLPFLSANSVHKCRALCLVPWDSWHLLTYSKRQL